MEQIKNYFTREGWSQDLKKTISRHPNIYKSLKEGFLGIKGLYDSIPLGIKLSEWEKAQQIRLSDSWERGLQDLEFCKEYSNKRDSALRRGNFHIAQRFEGLIKRITLQYIERL